MFSSHLLCSIDRSKKVIPGHLFMGKAPNSFLLGFWEPGTEAAFEPTEPCLPLAQNNPHTTETHLAVLVLNPYTVIKWIFLKNERLKAFQYFILIL